MKARLGWSMALVWMLAGCASNSFKSDFDPQANFAAIKTYSWGNNIAHGTANRFLNGTPLNQVIQDDIDAELASKGFKKVATGGDVTVQFKSIIRYIGAGTKTGSVDQTKMADSANDSFNLSVGNSGPVVQQAYTEGSVIVVIANATTGKPVWRGVGEGIVKQTVDDAKRAERLRKEVTKLLASFPPK